MNEIKKDKIIICVALIAALLAVLFVILAAISVDKTIDKIEAIEINYSIKEGYYSCIADGRNIKLSKDNVYIIEAENVGNFAYLEVETISWFWGKCKIENYKLYIIKNRGI